MVKYMIKTDEKIFEWCSNCQHEIELDYKFKAQKCIVCNERLLPCSMCIEMNCSKCPLEQK